MGYTDAILHIADLPALAVAMAAIDPPVVADGRFNLDTTPAVTNGPAALVYVRMSNTQAAQWRGMPGVTILAEAPYGPDTADAIYNAIWSDAAALTLYRAVYDPQPVLLEGGTVAEPSARFGVLL
jgi:hypothetical protein